MWEQFRRVWHIKSLRKSVLFVLLMLVVFRAASHIPIPGVDPEGLRALLQGNQILGFLNLFSGGTLKNFSVVMLGVAPYITASIILQVLTMVVPQLDELSKEGESGRAKINMYTRIATIPLAMLQAFGLIQVLNSSQAGVVSISNTFTFVSVILVAAAGTVFLMWIGELITEQHIGNGVSLIIFAGIVSALPNAVQTALVNYNPSDLMTYILFVAIFFITIVGVVFITEGQRNIPVNYARRTIGTRSFGGTTTFLPLKINMAGVIPIIFAVSIVITPSVIAQFLMNTGHLVSFSQHVISFFQNQLYYGIIYFVAVFGFTYFYTAIIFQPQKMAENLQRQGGFIPGIRPGKETEKYLSTIMNRLLFSGALFLGIIAILPLFARAFTGSQNLAIGGTSLLIVVSVAIDIAKQLQAQVTTHEYDRI